MKKRIISILFVTIVGFSLSATAVAAELDFEVENVSEESSAEVDNISEDADNDYSAESATESEKYNDFSEDMNTASDNKISAESEDESKTEDTEESIDDLETADTEESIDDLETVEELEKETVEETETSCTDICHVKISYEKEYYVIENLCPTGEAETMNLQAEFCVEKGHELEINLDEVSPEVRNIISKVDELSGELNCSYEIKAKVSADGKVSIKNVSTYEAEEVSCEVTVFTETEKSKTESKEQETSPAQDEIDVKLD